MSCEIRCPECDSRNVSCVEKPHHNHVCHACGHSVLPVPAEQALTEAADWIVHELGIPHDMNPGEPPPLAVRHAIYNVIHSDRTGRLHGNELSFPEVVAWVNDESGWEQEATA